MIHLDTSFLIRGIVRGSSEEGFLRAWMKEGETLAMSTVAWAELLCGPLGVGEAELAARMVNERIPFLAEDAVLAAKLFNGAGRRRGSIMDCMIAATAMRVGASLATANPRDFRRIVPAGLRLVGS